MNKVQKALCITLCFSIIVSSCVAGGHNAENRLMRFVREHPVITAVGTLVGGGLLYAWLKAPKKKIANDKASQVEDFFYNQGKDIGTRIKSVMTAQEDNEGKAEKLRELIIRSWCFTEHIREFSMKDISRAFADYVKKNHYFTQGNTYISFDDFVDKYYKVERITQEMQIFYKLKSYIRGLMGELESFDVAGYLSTSSSKDDNDDDGEELGQAFKAAQMVAIKLSSEFIKAESFEKFHDAFERLTPKVPTENVQFSMGLMVLFGPILHVSPERYRAEDFALLEKHKA